MMAIAGTNLTCINKLLYWQIANAAGELNFDILTLY